MIIGIDGNEANTKERVGVNVYAFELLRHIYQLSELWREKHKFVVYLSSRPMSHMPPENSSWKYKVIPGSKVWIVTKLLPTLYKQKFFSKKNSLDASGRSSGELVPDLFFSPHHYAPPFSPIPTVCSIMDLGYLEFSGQFKKYDFWQLSLWSAYSILVSKCIITISESTKRDIVRHYPSSAKKVFVTYPGYDPARFNTKIPMTRINAVRAKYNIDGEYILFLSTLKPSKNLVGLLKAYAEVIKQYQDIKLVVAGRKGWLYNDIFSKIRDLGIEDKVIFTDFLPEEEKPALIAGAKIFCLPSFWEGFGLDIVSSMACGVPPVVSKSGSIPEVVGDAGVKVDAESVESITKGLIKVLSLGKVDYNKLVRAGLSQAKKFSWEKAARSTLEILENAI